MSILCGDRPGLRHSQKHLRVSAQGSIMLKSKGQYLIYSLRNMAAARFAVAAASLQCTAVGPTAFPIEEIRELGASLAVEYGPSPIRGV